MFTLEVASSQTDIIKHKLKWVIEDFNIEYNHTHTRFVGNFGEHAYTPIEKQKFSRVFSSLGENKAPYTLRIFNEDYYGKLTGNSIHGFNYTQKRYPNYLNQPPTDNLERFSWDEQHQKYCTYQLLQIVS